MGLSLSLQLAVVYLPLLNEAFGTRPLDLGQWLVCFAMASIVLWVDEIKKLLVRAKSRRRLCAELRSGRRTRRRYELVKKYPILQRAVISHHRWIRKGPSVRCVTIAACQSEEEIDVTSRSFD